MSADTYERLDEHEIGSVRAYRRQLWAERAQRDPNGARDQIVRAIRLHADPWTDDIPLQTVASVALRGKKIGDLNHAQRYALISILEDAA